MGIDINKIITLNLRYGHIAEPLKTRAFAQMIAKVLYVYHNVSLSIDIIEKDLATVLSCDGVDKITINDALTFLNNQGHVERVGKKWIISEKGIKQIKESVDDSATRIEQILERHFNFEISKDKLYDWFTEANLLFFGKYGDNWVRSICKTNSLKDTAPINLVNIVNTAIEKYSLGQHKEKLLIGFYSYVTSTIPQDAQQLWVFGQAMFAAKLVAANISADPLTSVEIKDSLILLDTNMLFAASLEKHILATSLSSLAKALEYLNVSLHYLKITEDEYNVVIR